MNVRIFLLLSGFLLGVMGNYTTSNFSNSTTTTISPSNHTTPTPIPIHSNHSCCSEGQIIIIVICLVMLSIIGLLAVRYYRRRRIHSYSYL